MLKKKEAHNFDDIGGWVAQRKHSCFPPSSPEFDSWPSQIFLSWLLSWWTEMRLNSSRAKQLILQIQFVVTSRAKYNKKRLIIRTKWAQIRAWMTAMTQFHYEQNIWLTNFHRASSSSRRFPRFSGSETSTQPQPSTSSAARTSAPTSKPRAATSSSTSAVSATWARPTFQTGRLEKFSQVQLSPFTP